MGFSKASKIGQPGEAGKLPGIVLFDRTIRRDYPEINPEIILTSDQMFAARAGISTSGRYPDPFFLGRFDMEVYISEVTYSYGIRPAGTISLPNNDLRILASVGIADPLFTVPYNTDPAPPGGSRTYNWADGMFFKLDPSNYNNIRFDLDFSKSGVFEFSFEFLRIKGWYRAT